MTRQLVSIAVGGAIGSLGRYGLLTLLGGVDDGVLPWGTLSANIIGSLVLGFVLRLSERGAFSEGMRLFLAVGLLGGFTTFSFFSYENIELLRDDRFLTVVTNVLIQLAVGIAVATAGYRAGDMVGPQKKRER